MGRLQGQAQPVRTAVVHRNEPPTGRTVPASPAPSNKTPPQTPDVVKSGLLNLDQYLFGIGLAAKTGLSLRVITAWMVAEEPASASATERGHNWLNVGVGSSGGPKGAGYGWSGVKLAGTGNPGYKFSNVADAVRETSWWINHMGNYAGIKRSAGESDYNQLAAIALSPWDAGHYNGGASLRAAYAREGGGGSSIFGDVGGWLGSGASGVSDVAGSVASGVTGAASNLWGGVTSVADFLQIVTDKRFWIRFAFVLVGLGFGFIGLVAIFSTTKAGQTALAAAPALAMA